jgi:hypothetical protein
VAEPCLPNFAAKGYPVIFKGRWKWNYRLTQMKEIVESIVVKKKKKRFGVRPSFGETVFGVPP